MRQLSNPTNMESSSLNPCFVEAKEIHNESSHSCAEKQSLKSERNQLLNKEDGEMNKCDYSSEPLDKNKKEEEEEESGRGRLKRHRKEVAGRVWIPDIWGQEDFLKDWIDCSAFEANFVPRAIMSARSALAKEGRSPNASCLRIGNRC